MCVGGPLGHTRILRYCSAVRSRRLVQETRVSVLKEGTKSWTKLSDHSIHSVLLERSVPPVIIRWSLPSCHDRVNVSWAHYGFLDYFGLKKLTSKHFSTFERPSFANCCFQGYEWTFDFMKNKFWLEGECQNNSIWIENGWFQSSFC